MITERQISLLKIIVEEYIKTARPVGSKAICAKLKCSSATVRNELAELEKNGYLDRLIHHQEEFHLKKDIVFM